MGCLIRPISECTSTVFWLQTLNPRSNRRTIFHSWRVSSSWTSQQKEALLGGTLIFSREKLLIIILSSIHCVIESFSKLLHDALLVMCSVLRFPDWKAEICQNQPPKSEFFWVSGTFSGIWFRLFRSILATKTCSRSAKVYPWPMKKVQTPSLNFEQKNGKGYVATAIGFKNDTFPSIHNCKPRNVNEFKFGAKLQKLNVLDDRSAHLRSFLELFLNIWVWVEWLVSGLCAEGRSATCLTPKSTNCFLFRRFWSSFLKNVSLSLTYRQETNECNQHKTQEIDGNVYFAPSFTCATYSIFRVGFIVLHSLSGLKKYSASLLHKKLDNLCYLTNISTITKQILGVLFVLLVLVFLTFIYNFVLVKVVWIFLYLCRPKAILWTLIAYPHIGWWLFCCKAHFLYLPILANVFLPIIVEARRDQWGETPVARTNACDYTKSENRA